MRKLLLMPLLAAVLVGCAKKIDYGESVVFVSDLRDGADGSGTPYDPFRSLETAIDSAASGSVIQLLAGTYEAVPQQFDEAECGNCESHLTAVHATAGFVIRGKVLTIRGANRDSCILITKAGYGLLFEQSYGSSVSNVTITGGVRDPDGNATDAAIVVKYSRVTIENCLITGNINRDTTVVVGIGGIFGRESSTLIIHRNTIRNNGWDGIALYRGAVALITDNTIDSGRGAGIGITWDSDALVQRNRISNYWKGIGTFGNSRAVVQNNVVFDNLGWGIILTASSFMEVRNNTIARNGNCGLACWSEEARGVAINNIIVKNGWREEWVCPCVGVQMWGKVSNFPISYNNVWGNVAGNYKGMPTWTGLYGNISVDPMFTDSLDFHLKDESPLWHAGDPYYTDPDGTQSSMGAYGGQGDIEWRLGVRRDAGM
jgi:parallel beta-helix repeat protein